MSDKVCIITGANSGLGKVTANAMAKQGFKVVMVCRNKEKGEVALSEIRKETGNTEIRLMVADLSSQKEIRLLAREIITAYPRINVLINNAGAVNGTRTETVDGIETTFATNHLAYFLLTNLLLENLKATPGARIVNVASEAQRTGKINFTDLNLKKNYTSFNSYSQSKLANIIFTYELARRLEGTNVTVNCIHPGVVRTNFGKSLTGLFKFILMLIVPFMRKPEKGAETIIWLATATELNGISGKYFSDKKQINSNIVSYDLEVAKKLWEISEQMTKPG